jgi:RNA-dependent RNA polymerase
MKTDHLLDVGVCIFEPKIVDAFRTPPVTAEPPSFLARFFEPQDKIPTVAAMIEEMRSSQEEAENILRRHLLIGLTDSKVGRCSMLHDIAMYMFGYDHEDTIRLAYMFVYLIPSFSASIS